MAATDSAATLLCVIPPTLGMIWALKEFVWLRSIKLTGPNGKGLQEPLGGVSAGEVDKILKSMEEISSFIAVGATAFLNKEYQYMVVYMIGFSCILFPLVGAPTCLAFNVGCITSCACGYIGMKVAVYANVRTAHEAWLDLQKGFNVALRAGSVMGFCLVSLGVFVLFGLLVLFRGVLFSPDAAVAEDLYEALAGYGLGGSSIALFGRVGGGIYTKAADVGADLSGKNEFGIDEDDPRNPACIADNVGDNVGDVAGMGADLFGSFAESTCAAFVIAGSSYKVADGIAGNYPATLFPLLLSSVGIIVGLVTMMVVGCFYKVNEVSKIESALKGVLNISTVLQTPAVIALAYYVLPASFALDEKFDNVTPEKCIASVLLGLWSGLVIGYATEYYTSHTYRPVREISETQRVSAATGIIYGLALGYLSCIVPTICIGITVAVAHTVAGMYGVALGALGMLGTVTMGLAIDVYGPISDNAGGIAEMSKLGAEVRRKTDALDAAGNTTAAIGKGFAIGSAALVSLALFGAFTVRAKIVSVDILDPWTFTGLLYGAMMPYAFSAMTMKSVGTAANDMVKECLAQLKEIFENNAKPNYERCIAISTDASLREMIAPGALVIISPLLGGVLFGKNCTAGMLSGALVSGVQLAVSMSNSGGAWDNAKKYIESGGLGPEHAKGSNAHKAAVIGDTVGDPLKDTSGPSLNIVVKLSAIMSLVFGSVIADYSGPTGGPFWLK